jgi:uncharacterized protein YdhG (YjbR/CyaY superfamily)
MLPVKQAKATRRNPRSKRKGAPKSFAAYLAGVPEHARGRLKQMRAAIRSAVPREATETISYGIPAFRHDGVIVWFAAFSKHCSLFPTGAILEAFANELKGFSSSKGTVHFPVDRPLPLGLIKRMVKARVAHMKSKKRA